MLRKPVIYVRRITNLSDARYCAGMGVDLLGFVIDPSDVDYVSPAHYQEMIGWVAGPRRVIEVTKEGNDWDEVIKQYKPDLIHISRNLAARQTLPDLPLVIEIPFEELSSVQTSGLTPGPPSEPVIRAGSPGERGTPTKTFSTTTEFILINKFPGGHAILPASKNPILLSLENDQNNLAEFLDRTGASGVALQGSRELSPGLKDYDHLSRILEELDR